MLILAFDTAAPVVSVAVHDGERVVGEATGADAMAHGESLAPAMAVCSPKYTGVSKRASASRCRASR